jgi:hypothetical protein
MEEEDRSLHPRVIRVARVVDVAAVHFFAIVEELIYHIFEPLFYFGVFDVAGLLGELALSGRADLLARIDNSTRYSPPTTIFS